MGTVIHDQPGDHVERHQRGEHTRRAARLDPSGARHAQGVSQRHSAQGLPGPSTTRPAWRAWQETLEACPRVVELCASGPGLACLARRVMAGPGGCVEMGARGMRQGCLWVAMPGLHRVVGACCGTPPRSKRGGAAALVASTREQVFRYLMAAKLSPGSRGPLRTIGCRLP